MDPEASAPPKTPRVLACVLCQQRKIRCDRATPCSNCEKAGITCTPSIPAPARKTRRTNRDLRERLAKCEALLQQYAPSSSTPLTGSSASTPPNSTPGIPSGAPSAFPSGFPTVEELAETFANFTHEDPMPTLNMPAGKLILEGGSAKYVDSFPFATIQKQIQAMREDLEAEEESVGFGDSPTNFTLLINSTVNHATGAVAPSPVQIFKLWQIFLDRVNPVTKVIHMPSLQPIVVDATVDHVNISNQTKALLFSIYAAAALSLKENEARDILQMSKEDALRNFGSGVCIYLTKGKFLQQNNLTTLQTFLLYLFSLHGRADRHTIWILSGMLLRMAQKLGLHRDGDALDVTPFEAEMRRRIWWQIVLADTRHAIASGFREPLLNWNWDTKFPHNVNDADLYPDFKEPVRSRDSPTEMAFVLVLYEIAQFVIEHRITDYETLIHAGADGDAEDDVRTSETCRQLAQLLDMKLQPSEDRTIDPSLSPFHLLASQIRVVIRAELTCFFTPLRELPEWGVEMFTPEDNVFRILIVHMEHHFGLQDKVKNTNFEWFSSYNFESDALWYLAGQMQQRVVGSLVDRAWVLLERAFYHNPGLWDMTKSANAKIGRSILKAWRERERVVLQSGIPFEVPPVVSKLQAVVPITSPSPMPPTHAIAPMVAHEALLNQLSGFNVDINQWQF